VSAASPAAPLLSGVGLVPRVGAGAAEPVLADAILELSHVQQHLQFPIVRFSTAPGAFHSPGKIESRLLPYGLELRIRFTIHFSTSWLRSTEPAPK
jgi:hypothetical protein